MKARLMHAGAIALVSLCAGCATWHDMDRTEKGTAVGATGGAVAGAVVGGPIGAAVGAGIGGYAGHHETQPGGLAAKNDTHVAARPSSNAANTTYDPALVRSAQQSLSDRGYNVGPVDGQWGPTTEGAVRQFQQAANLPQTGNLDRPTLSALGVSR